MENLQLSLEQRVARLEGKLGWFANRCYLDNSFLLISVAISCLAFVVGIVGLDYPNHLYQIVLAAVAVGVLYHRDLLAHPKQAWGWIVAVANCAMLSVILKLVLGGGERRPFFWMLYPTVTKEGAVGKESWLNVLPELSVQWQESGASLWAIDLTIVQTFLLTITIIGSLFSFQPFVSLTAFLLVIVSIPALVGFNWSFVFPAIILAGISLYLQSSSFHREDEL